MRQKEFESGDLVWAKMKGFPPWPAKIISPPADSKPHKHKRPQHYVYFFGSKNYAWILDANIIPHAKSMLHTVNRTKSATYQRAVEAIINHSKLGDMPAVVESKAETFETSVRKANSNLVAMKCVKKKQRKELKRLTSKKITIEEVPKKILRRHPVLFNTPIKRKTASAEPQSSCDDDFSALFESVSSSMRCPSVTDEGNSSGSSPSMKKESPPELRNDVKKKREVLKTKHVYPTTKRIGFIGLGLMGKGIVNNLIQSGHRVAVWNRTHVKCDRFVNAGALKCRTPASVVENSDIIFCCVSDPDAAKSLIFESHGILTGMRDKGYTKGYVEMTSVDPETSQEIAEAITGKGARFLESPVKGSKQQAEEGSLFILAAGSRSLFTECETCFHAMGHHAYFLSTEVGCASKMSLIHSMLHGTVYVALAEAMALVERSKLSPTDLFNILQNGNLRCSGLVEKGRAILTRNYTPNTALQYMQKDMSFALSLGGCYDQPLPVTAAANEVYKHAKKLNYKNFDVCAVFQAMRY